MNDVVLLILSKVQLAWMEVYDTGIKIHTWVHQKNLRLKVSFECRNRLLLGRDNMQENRQLLSTDCDKVCFRMICRYFLHSSNLLVIFIQTTRS